MVDRGNAAVKIGDCHVVLLDSITQGFHNAVSVKPLPSHYRRLSVICINYEFVDNPSFYIWGIESPPPATTNIPNDTSERNDEIFRCVLQPHVTRVR